MSLSLFKTSVILNFLLWKSKKLKNKPCDTQALYNLSTFPCIFSATILYRICASVKLSVNPISYTVLCA